MTGIITSSIIIISSSSSSSSSSSRRGTIHFRKLSSLSCVVSYTCLNAETYLQREGLLVIPPSQCFAGSVKTSHYYYYQYHYDDDYDYFYFKCLILSLLLSFSSNYYYYCVSHRARARRNRVAIYLVPGFTQTHIIILQLFGMYVCMYGTQLYTTIHSYTQLYIYYRLLGTQLYMAYTSVHTETIVRFILRARTNDPHESRAHQRESAPRILEPKKPSRLESH